MWLTSWAGNAYNARLFALVCEMVCCCVVRWSIVRGCSAHDDLLCVYVFLARPCSGPKEGAAF